MTILTLQVTICVLLVLIIVLGGYVYSQNERIGLLEDVNKTIMENVIRLGEENKQKKKREVYITNALRYYFPNFDRVLTCVEPIKRIELSRYYDNVMDMFMLSVPELEEKIKKHVREDVEALSKVNK